MVTHHGSAVVYAAGLASLGFPPTWAITARDFAAVRRSIPK